MIGRRHVAHIAEHPDMELVGVIDPVPLELDVPRFDAIEDVDVAADAIIIATPSDLHADHAEAAAARGWHMLIEKPVASDLGSAARIIAAVDRADVRVLVGHHRRHHARVRKLKAVLDGGTIGRPLIASLIWAVKKPDAYFDVAWRSGRDGSPVFINLVHEVDTLRYLFGDVAQVSGVGSNAQRGAARVETGAVTLGFDGGVVATVAFSDAAPSPWSFEAGTGENPNIATTGLDMLRVVGTQGGVSFPSLRVWTGAADWSEAPVERREDAASNVPLVAQLDHFVDVVAGRADAVVDAREGAASLRATLQIEEAVSRFDWAGPVDLACGLGPPARAIPSEEERQ